MSRTISILVVIITSLVVIAACILNIAGLLGSLYSGTTAEWADLFKWNDNVYISTYTTIDSDYIDAKQGEISATISRSVDTSTYIPENGEATSLSEGTGVYSVKGYDASSYLAVDDDGDYFLYCTRGSDTDEIIAVCGEKSYKIPVDFVYVSIPTVSKTVDDKIVRIRIIDSYRGFKNYIERYEKDFTLSDGSYTYEKAVDDRAYSEEFFEDKKIIAIYVPEEKGNFVYSVSSLMADKSKMTLILKKTFLPGGITYDTGATRHMFLEIDENEYTDQKLEYQIEPTVLPNAELKAGMSASEAMKATVKTADSLDDLLGTKYEPLVKGVYTREYFDRNMLMIVECSDGVGKSTYSLNSLVNEGGFLKILIDRETDPDAVPDLRMQYITVEYAKSDYNGEIVVPTVNLPENEVNDGGEINKPDGGYETDAPADSGQPGTPPTPPEAEGKPPSDYSPRDLRVVSDTAEVTELAEIYGLPKELYGEDFFENYVLLFVGDAVSSESVEYRYSSCVKTEDGIVITVDEIVPEKCVSRPACKYIAIPYLRSEYSGEQLHARLNTVYESRIPTETTAVETVY